MNRNDLMDVDIAVMDFLQAYPDAPMAKIIRAAVDAAEPLIREDERQRTPVVYERDLQPLADLRAKVAALPHDTRCHVSLMLVTPVMCSCWKRDVLALLDGGTP